jgi:mannose-6-phosphate isomerase
VTTAVNSAVCVLDNPVREYAWGSRTAIPDLLGMRPSGEPQAELWMGAHPATPSTVVRNGRRRSLLTRIEADPVGELGENVAAEFGPRLPFLLKVIAADAPLSMQAHPDAARAVEGYVEENARGIPLDAPERNYRDSNHKPELLVALGPFDALCGFRAIPETVRLLEVLVTCASSAPAGSLAAKAAGALGSHLAALRARPDQHGLREVVTRLVTLPEARRVGLVSAVAAACRRSVTQAALAGAVRAPFVAEARTAADLAEAYPGDVGVVIALLLNLVHLDPGEAIFVPAGNLHAYLRGVAVEIMANSDNVLRGGLTPKHVDVPELLRVLDVTAGPVTMPRPRPAGQQGEEVYRVPVREFQLSRVRVTAAAPVRLGAGGPQILLVVDGAVTVAAVGAHGTGAGPDAGLAAGAGPGPGFGGEPVLLERGASAWIPAGVAVTAVGEGTAFRATTNLC